MDLIVTSTVDGRRRGGGQFTGATRIDPDKFVPAQLLEIMSDPALTLVYGDILTPANVEDALEHARDVKAAKLEVAGAAAAKIATAHGAPVQVGETVKADIATLHPELDHTSTAGDHDHEKDVVHPTTETGLETGKPIVHQGTESVGHASQKPSTQAANKAAAKGAKA